MATCRTCGCYEDEEDVPRCRRCDGDLYEPGDDGVSASDADVEVPALFGVDGLDLSFDELEERHYHDEDLFDADHDDDLSDADHDDDLFDAYEKITKSMMANLERDLLSLAAAAEGLQPLVARSCGAILPKKATVVDVTDAMRNMTVSPSKRLKEKTEVEPTIVESPSKRHRGKQAPSLVARRNPKLCQHADCVFSRKHPGQPAWCPDAEHCQWCDSAVMAASLQDPGQAEVRQTPPAVLLRPI